MTTIEYAIKATQGMSFVTSDLQQLRSASDPLVCLLAEQLHRRAIELENDLRRLADAVESTQGREPT